MKVMHIIGARPQFVKAAPVIKAIRESNFDSILIHTGQHYDYEMSRVIFEQLNIPKPDINLDVGSGTHGWQTGEILIRIEKVLLEQKVDWVLVYGDTNTTLAAALAASKLRVPLAHVEAGLRSFNKEMPEEHNRILTDHCSDVLFCPTKAAVDNLFREGIIKDVHRVGDTMYDAVLQYQDVAERKSTILKSLGLKPGQYLLATVHRPCNADREDRLEPIFQALETIARRGIPIVVPMHPRTKRTMEHMDLIPHAIQCLNPVSYMDMLVLEKNAKGIITDSGGVQKEAYWFRVPCITLRKETEWMETVSLGWNVLVGANSYSIVRAVETIKPGEEKRDAYNDGRACNRIVQIISGL
jgi:UDP-N-acetylglucosamine 2-epimerase